MRRIAAFGALFGVLTVLLAGAGAAQAQPRALIGFIPTAPAPKMPLLFDLAQRDFSYGVTSPTLGAYSKRQMLLDMSEGSRLARKRARDAPGDVVPGLLASSLQQRGHRVGYVGVYGIPQSEAMVAANRRGHIDQVSMGTIGTFATRALRMWQTADVLVARFPSDESGLAALDGILAHRRPDDLILVIRAPPAGQGRLLPSGMIGPGTGGAVLY